MNVLKDMVEIPIYVSNDLTWNDFFGNKLEKIKAKFPMLAYDTAEEIVKISDYNKIAKLYGIEQYELKDDEYIMKALEVGAKGYILKQDFEGILPALLAVQSGQSVFGDEIISKFPAISHSEEENLLQKRKNCYKEKDISEKELDIIRLVADGLSNKEIAAALFLSEGTIRNYLSNILDKLDLRDRTQLAVYYYKHL